jgi:Flp pilus assembly pilin Flp
MQPPAPRTPTPADITTGALRESMDMAWGLMRYWRDDAAASAIEYALIASLIAVAVLSMVAKTGAQINGKFIAVANGLG